MTSEHALPDRARASPAALDLALEHTQDVRDKVEGCAADLASKNEVVKQQIAHGVTTLPANDSLRETEAIEAKISECADDLHEVSETLAQGVEDLKDVRSALAGAKAALAETESSLAVAQEDERRFRQQALHDAATGLPNRNLFNDRLEQAIALAGRQKWTLAVMFLDLDRFKLINDNHGHAIGDLVLTEVARRLLGHARDEDTVCRLGGDEFLYLLVNPKGPTNVERIAKHILASISVPIKIEALDLLVTPSIGVALFPEHALTGADLIACADAAMYLAKRQMCGYAVCGQAEAMDTAAVVHP